MCVWGGGNTGSKGGGNDGGECVCLSMRVSMTLRLCVVDSVPEADGE